MRKSMLAALAAVLISGTPLAAQDYPTGTITILVPFSPGGVVDIAARTVAEQLSDRWGQEVLVENRTGGSGFIAAQAAAQAEPDGHTLLMAESGVSAINPVLFDEVPYNMEEDFIPLTAVTNTPLVLVARADAPYDTLEEFVTYAKENPGEVTYASAGVGTLNHLAPEWFAMEAGIDYVHVPYRGGRPAATAVAGGEADVGILSVSSVDAFVESGDIKVLAVAADERTDKHPDAPTLPEAGYDVDAGQWTGLFVPSGTPQPVVDKLHAEITDILNEPAVVEALTARGADPMPMPQAEFAAMIERLRTQFGKIVETAGIEPQ